VIAGCLAIALAATVPSALAQPRHGGQGPCGRSEGLLSAEDRQWLGERFMLRLQERLAVTPAQAEELRGALQAQRVRLREDVRAVCETRLELQRLLERQDADAAELREAAERVKVSQGRLLDRRIEMHAAMRSILTPEQWQTWLEIRRGLAGRHRSRGPGV
jgi:Spy/CpxP family protein refolding chaperone